MCREGAQSKDRCAGAVQRGSERILRVCVPPPTPACLVWHPSHEAKCAHWLALLALPPRREALARWAVYFHFKLAEYSLTRDSPSDALCALEGVGALPGLTPTEQVSCMVHSIGLAGHVQRWSCKEPVVYTSYGSRGVAVCWGAAACSLHACMPCHRCCHMQAHFVPFLPCLRPLFRCCTC